MTTVHNFINGSWTAASATDFLDVQNPATGEPLGRTPLSTRADVGRAVDAASAAFPSWRATPVVERARILFRLRAMLEENKDTLARSLTQEHGKVLDDSRGEIQRGIENVEHACGAPSLMMGETLEDVARGIDCETVRQPLGVFAVIAPYNFPVMIPLWFWPYAAVTGNTVVLKPSEQDPITHQMIVDMAARAGLPPGVLNVVHGGREAVSALLEHPDVKGVSFVGSSETARFVYAKAAEHGKRVQALGGAKNHMIVLPDANMDAARDAVVASVFGAAGQRCLAGSIVVGVGDAYPAIREKVLDSAASLKVGYGMEPGVEMGPVISRKHRDRVLGFIDRGRNVGARVLLDGSERTVDGFPHGHWVGPTVFEVSARKWSWGARRFSVRLPDSLARIRLRVLSNWCIATRMAMQFHFSLPVAEPRVNSGITRG